MIPAISSGTATNSMVAAVPITNLVTMTADLRTGVASRWTMLPSSISAPSTLLPITSAVSGRTTVNPKSPRIRPGHGAAGCDALSASVTSTRIACGIARRKARLRPSAARSVIEATVRLYTRDMESLPSWG